MHHAAGQSSAGCGGADGEVSPEGPPPAPANALPTRLNDKEFWALETDISEPGGYFQIRDNFTSNEMEVGQLFTMLRDAQRARRRVHGRRPRAELHVHRGDSSAHGVHRRHSAAGRGAAPDVQGDLRDGEGSRGFHLAAFRKPRPPGLDTSASIQTIWEAYRTVATDSALEQRRLTARSSTG